MGNRYWSAPIESEPYLDACIRYTLWNPARAGIVDDPLDSSWTSLRASVGLEPTPRALAANDLLARFGRTPRTAQVDLLAYVLGGRERCLAPFGDGSGIVR